VRLNTKIDVASDVAALKELSEGVTLAVRVALPETEGFHEQVAEKFG
jgi:hypothetical protein